MRFLLYLFCAGFISSHGAVKTNMLINENLIEIIKRIIVINTSSINYCNRVCNYWIS